MYKPKTEKIIETDYISTDLITRYLGSKKFIDQLVSTADKTIQTGKEHGFPAVRIFNEKTITLPISEGTETEISLRDSYWHAPDTSDFYFFWTFMLILKMNYICRIRLISQMQESTSF